VPNLYGLNLAGGSWEIPEPPGWAAKGTQEIVMAMSWYSVRPSSKQASSVWMSACSPLRKTVNRAWSFQPVDEAFQPVEIQNVL
jgi:hypothetical protein